MPKQIYQPQEEKIIINPEEYIVLGERKGHILRDGDKIRYPIANKLYNFSESAEKARAIFYVELIEKYKYPIKKIRLEVEVPRRMPLDWVDIMVYEDDELQKPFLVVECKKDEISGADIEEVLGKAKLFKAKFAAVITEKKRMFFDLANQGDEISDLPVQDKI